MLLASTRTCEFYVKRRPFFTGLAKNMAHFFQKSPYADIKEASVCTNLGAKGPFYVIIIKREKRCFTIYYILLRIIQR
jgi:hypothetical protein